jgi:hypothetical protein
VGGSGYPQSQAGQIPARYAITTAQSAPIFVDNGGGSVVMGRLYANGNPTFYLYAGAGTQAFNSTSGWNIIPTLYNQTITLTLY